MSSVPTDIEPPIARGPRAGWINRLVSNPAFQGWAAHFPLTRRIVRRDGEELFSLISGFCKSQVLLALVQFDLFERLMSGPKTLRFLANAASVPEDRMRVLLRASCALGLLKPVRGNAYKLSRKGAALAGVPGLTDMIAHHDVLYRDLRDPAAFFRGETETELASFWPYVFGGDMEPQAAQTYSDLMSKSQNLVAQDTLRSVDLSAATTIMDVGGGTGAFLEAVGARYRETRLVLFDLPQVIDAAQARFTRSELLERTDILQGSFKTDPIPVGADLISLIRVLYDHEDSTVMALLRNCFEALPAGGRLLISEPMSGGKAPDPATDVYFAMYTLAMRTGKTRSAEEISHLCTEAGFDVIRIYPPRRAFVTQCVTAVKS